MVMNIIPAALTVVKYGFYSALSIVAVGGGLLYKYQTSLIYPANMPEGSRTKVPIPSDFGIESFEDITLITPDGVKIKAFVMLAGEKPEVRPTVILCHANAGNVGHRLPIAKVFLMKMRCNILALSYRGYGLSEGSANEAGLKLDAQTALDFVLSHPQLEKTKIFLYGQSIGGAVAIHLASQNTTRIHGLIVENTFLSLPKLVPHVLPFLSPFLFLLHQIWPSEKSIATLPADFPALFLSGGKDELVPRDQIRGLWEKCSSRVKEWKDFPDGMHNDTCMQPGYFATIANFISSHTASKTNSPESAATSLSSSVIISAPSSEFSGESFELISEGEEDEEEDEKENISDLPSTSGAGSTSDVSGVLRGEIQRRRSSVFGGAGSSVDMGRFVKEVGNDVRRRSSVFGGGHQTE